MTKRRVLDTTDHSYGTVVADLGRGKYRVHWDEPTPYQEEARVPIPSEHFIWAGATLGEHVRDGGKDAN